MEDRGRAAVPHHAMLLSGRYIEDGPHEIAAVLRAASGLKDDSVRSPAQLPLWASPDDKGHHKLVKKRIGSFADGADGSSIEPQTPPSAGAPPAEEAPPAVVAAAAAEASVPAAPAAAEPAVAVS